MSYLITKRIKINGKEVPVVLLDGFGDVWEFETEKEATEMAYIFETNSDSGYTYQVHKIK
jgi:hypothetical protein